MRERDEDIDGEEAKNQQKKATKQETARKQSWRYGNSDESSKLLDRRW